MTIHAAVTAARDSAPWYHSYRELCAFAGALVRGGLLTDADAVLAYFLAPSSWDAAHVAWTGHGCPDPDSEDDDERARWVAVEAAARGYTPPQPALEAIRSQTLRITWGDSDHFAVRSCYGRCSVCHEEMWDVNAAGAVDRHRPDPRRPGRCADCSYWSEMAATENDARRVVVAGMHHILIEGELSARYDPVYSIEFFDGRRGRGYLVSQGAIPQAWRAKLPDNARVAVSSGRAS